MAFLFLRFRISFDYIPEDIGRTREQHFASRTKDAGKCWTLEVSCYNNPTIGIVLCADTDEDIAKYSILHGNEQLFATKYKLYLPTEEELRAEIETQKTMFLLQQDAADRDKTE